MLKRLETGRVEVLVHGQNGRLSATSHSQSVGQGWREMESARRARGEQRASRKWLQWGGYGSGGPYLAMLRWFDGRGVGRTRGLGLWKEEKFEFAGEQSRTRLDQTGLGLS